MNRVLRLLGFVTLLVTVALLASWRLPNPIATSCEGAKLAISHLLEWTKWLAGIQTAAIGGLALLVFDSTTKRLKAMTPAEEWFALAAFGCLGIGLFISAWTLSALPSLAIRIHAIPKLPCDSTSTALSTAFDIYEQPLYGFAPMHLGYAMSFQHWLWGVGLLMLGLHVTSSFLKRKDA